MRSLFDVMDKLEEKGHTVEYDETICYLDIISVNGQSLSVKPIYLGKDDDELFIIPDFADCTTNVMNFYIESYTKINTMKVPKAKNLFNEIEKALA